MGACDSESDPKHLESELAAPTLHLDPSLHLRAAGATKQFLAPGLGAAAVGERSLGAPGFVLHTALESWLKAEQAVADYHQPKVEEGGKATQSAVGEDHYYQRRAPQGGKATQLPVENHRRYQMRAERAEMAIC